MSGVRASRNGLEPRLIAIADVSRLTISGISFDDSLNRTSLPVYFTSVLQNFSIRSNPFSMFAMLVA